MNFQNSTHQVVVDNGNTSVFVINATAFGDNSSALLLDEETNTFTVSLMDLMTLMNNSASVTTSTLPHLDDNWEGIHTMRKVMVGCFFGKFEVVAKHGGGRTNCVNHF